MSLLNQQPEATESPEATAATENAAEPILKAERFWQKPPPFDEAQLNACIKIVTYNRHINLRDCRLLSGIQPPVRYFVPYLDVLQKKVVDKADQHYSKNRSISRTMFMQLVATLRRVELPDDFPQERYQAVMVSLAEADALIGMMEIQAGRLRAEHSQGNLKFVEKLSK